VSKKIKLETSDKCTGCMVCADACPVDCISVTMKKDGHIYPKINHKQCIECRKCIDNCPSLQNYNFGSEIKQSKPYAAWSKNDKIRLKSSSGGVFGELALTILNREGYVCGVRMNGMKAEHIIISDEADLQQLMGSKYIQSNPLGIYKEVYELLSNGNEVLFSGVGCQIAALNHYLANKEYNGSLITVDIICHGIPSYFALSKHCETQATEKIISFRDKEIGWVVNGKSKSAALTRKLKNKKIIREGDDGKNFFFNVFYSDLTMRNSCYNCQFRFVNRKADISLADYWGIKSFEHEYKKGISFVLSHSQKGETLLDESQITKHITDWETPLKSNPAVNNNDSYLKRHPLRVFMPLFFNLLKKDFLNKLYTPNPPSTGFYKILWRINTYFNKKKKCQEKPKLQ